MTPLEHAEVWRRAARVVRGMADAVPKAAHHQSFNSDVSGIPYRTTWEGLSEGAHALQGAAQALDVIAGEYEVESEARRREQEKRSAERDRRLTERQQAHLRREFVEVLAEGCVALRGPVDGLHLVQTKVTVGEGHGRLCTFKACTFDLPRDEVFRRWPESTFQTCNFPDAVNFSARSPAVDTPPP